MKKFLIATAALMLSALAMAAPTGIASGSPTGTNYPMAEDIKRVCSTATVPINNVVTQGSLENIDRIYTDSNTQYGIIQVDALEYQKGIDPKMMTRIVTVFPFFSTEFHLVGKYGSKIVNLSDLVGKRVVEGPQGSGTWVTVQVIKALTGLSWIAINASQQEGFNMVMKGQADAEFIVAGKPVTMLQIAKGYKLIPISHPSLDKFDYYTKTTIFAGTYDAVQDTVPTYKVDNVLATYAFTNQYQKEIGDLVSCITKNIDVLRTTGHPKWKDVNPLDIDRIKWTTHPAAVAAIKRESAKKR